MFYQTVPDIGY